MSETLRQKYKDLIEHSERILGLQAAGKLIGPAPATIAKNLLDALKEAVETSEERPWMVVLKPYPVSDFRVVGPFATAEDAQAFSERFMGRSAFEVRLDKPEDYTT